MLTPVTKRFDPRDSLTKRDPRDSVRFDPPPPAASATCASRSRATSSARGVTLQRGVGLALRRRVPHGGGVLGDARGKVSASRAAAALCSRCCFGALTHDATRALT